jgi:hypothetical protein
MCGALERNLLAQRFESRLVVSANPRTLCEKAFQLELV